MTRLFSGNATGKKTPSQRAVPNEALGRSAGIRHHGRPSKVLRRKSTWPSGFKWNLLAKTHPMTRKSDTGQVLKALALKLGVPAELAADGWKERTTPGTDFMKCCHQKDAEVHRAQPK
jgi:hypothetical protein